MPISTVLFAIVYGWEFRDASGSAADSSFFANAVNIEPHGSLRLSKLSAPSTGHFPMRIRCRATLARRLPTVEGDGLHPRFYTSDYVSLWIMRKDGTVTAPRSDHPDLQGNRVSIHVNGLHPSGTLERMPGEDAELECVATDQKRNLTITSNEAIFDWSLIRSNGQKLSNGQVAREVTLDGSLLKLKHVLFMNSNMAGSMGRCEVFYNGQAYYSSFFKLDFRPKYPEEQIEGDGKLVVDINGANKALGLVELTSNKKTLQCVAIDFKTRKQEADITYDWEYYTSPGGDLPDLPDVMDSERIETFTEDLNGKLTLKGTNNRIVEGEKVTLLRCRVTKEGVSYTSPYYTIRLKNENFDAWKLEEKPVPQYWARVDGLDSMGYASVDPGDTLGLSCQAVDTKTGNNVNEVDYLWEVRKTDGRLVDMEQIAAGEVTFRDKELTIRNIKPAYGTLKGRCIVVDRTTKDQFPSSFFKFAIPSDFNSGDAENQPPEIFDVSHDDDRVNVWVADLNELYSLNAIVGENRSLTCNAQTQITNAKVLGYTWQFINEHAQLVSPSVLANEVKNLANGTLRMNGLRAYKDRRGYNAVGGRCLAVTQIINDDGKEMLLRFPSEYFNIIIRDTIDPVLPKVPEDLQGEFVVVEVDGLNKYGNLKAEPGDSVTLTCEAKDVETNEVNVAGAQSWKFTDSLGREVPAESIAMSVERIGHQLTLTHLRPTPENKTTHAKCIIFSDRRKRFYSSVPFEVIVKHRDPNAQKEDDDVVVDVFGDVTDSTFTGLPGGDGKLYCSAKSRETGMLIPPADAEYKWEFEVNGQLKLLDTMAGEVAAKVIQASDPDNSQGSMLQLKGVRAPTKWTQARCFVIVTKAPENVGKVYYSAFFISGSASDLTTSNENIITDPRVSIRVQGLDNDSTVKAYTGDDKTLKCFAIDMFTGLPIERACFTWDLRTKDDQPLTSTRLAKQVRVSGGELRLYGLEESSRFVKARCLASLLSSTDGPVRCEPKIKYPFYTSPLVRFFVTQKEGVPKSTEPKIDISSLKVEVHGISPSGTLTDVAGNNKTLDCIVTDKWVGAPVVDGISVGWMLATGPDNQPFELSQLAESVEFSGSKLILTALHKTGKYSGGLRGRCVISAKGVDAHEVPMVKSEVFAIHILPKPVIDSEEVREHEEEKDMGLPIAWLPGAEPKDAVYVIIHGLNRDGEFVSNVGSDATIACVAHDTKTRQQLKVGSPNNEISLRFGWELRDKYTGDELSFNHLVSGQVIMTQSTQGVDARDASAVSRLRLEGLLSTSGKSLHGRCTASLNGQRYRSAYFPISIGGIGVPESVRTVDDIPGFYESGGAINVVVSDLNSDGGKVVHEGTDAKLTCTAINSKSKIRIPEKSVFYGWRLLNAEGHELPPGLLNAVRTEGNTLTMTKVSYKIDGKGNPEPIYGWCIAGVKRPTGLPGLQRYRSDTFIIYPDGEVAANRAIADKPEITVTVSNVGGDEDFLVSPGEDIEMLTSVIDAKTGDAVPPNEVSIGWEWTDMSGLRPINLGEFASGGEKLTPEGTYTAYKVRLPQSVRGRAVVIYSRPGEDQKWRYTSPYVFLSPDREFVLSEGEEPNKEVSFDEATDSAVLLKITGLNDKGQFRVSDEGKGEITIAAIDAATGKVLTKDTKPALVGYGWNAVSPNTLDTHYGAIAEFINMDSTSGKLTLINPQIRGQKVLLQMTSLVEMQTVEGARIVIMRKRYKSDLIPLLLHDDAWIDDSRMDLTAKSAIVTIEGLDENGDVAVSPGADVELKAVVKDTSGVEVKVSGYSWKFISPNGYFVAPSLISKSFEESADGRLKLSVIQPSAIADGVRGRCRVAVDREDVEGYQYYDSPWFNFKPSDKMEAGKTDDPGVSTNEKDNGFTLKIVSNSSVIYPNVEGEIVMARPHLPLELNCVAEFPEGVNQQLSESGTPIPQLAWHYRRPEIPGDVPIPAELYRLEPGKMETLLISEISESVIRISSDHYDFSDDLAEFQCHAMDGNKTLATQTVFINRVKERIRVQVFDEKLRTAVYALEKSKATLSCYVEDELHGGQVDPLNYKWNAKLLEQTWDMGIEVDKMATSVSGLNDKALILDGLLVAEGDKLSTSYQLRCVAQYNETYFVASRSFAINVHRTPELKSIRLELEKPEFRELTNENTEDIFDASKDYLVSCKPDFSAGSVQSEWEKYDEESGDWYKISPPSDKLFLIADSTEYDDAGLYRCRVIHSLHDYDYYIVKTHELKLRRIAGPAPSTKDKQSFTVNDELMLQCTDRSASPQVEVEWSFKASPDAPPKDKHPLVIGKYSQHGRTNVFIIPRGQLLESHSGTYICTRTNEHGQATTSIDVHVKPYFFEAI